MMKVFLVYMAVAVICSFAQERTILNENDSVGANISYASTKTVKVIKPIVVGMLIQREHNANTESLLTLISSLRQQLYDQYEVGRIQLNVTSITLSEPGGLLRAIDYFQSNNAKIILDLQRSNKAEILGDYLKVPVVTMVPQTKPRGDFIISMYPSITIINSAIVEFMLSLQIVEAILLYDERRSSQATNLHTQCRENYIKIAMTPELQMNDMAMIKDVIRMMWNKQIKTVVLLCDTQDIKTVFNASLQSRLYDKDRKDWKWIVSDMDFEKPDYEPLEGFVGFSLPVPSIITKPRINETVVKEAFNGTNYSQVYYASVLDAVYLINEAVVKVEETFGNDPVTGKDMLDAITNVSLPRCYTTKQSRCGLTGEIQFDKTGERRINELDFVVVEGNKLNKEWKWNSVPQMSHFPQENEVPLVGDVVGNYLCHEVRDKQPMKKEKRNLTILFLKDDRPFVLANATTKQEDFKGFVVDIVKKLQETLNFDYHFKIQESGGSGKLIKGQWTGMIGALVRQEVDIAVGSFTITSSREEVIDFSKPFMDFKMALIHRKPEQKESLFNFHKPFSSDIWLMVVLSVFGMTFLLFGVDYFSPLGNRNTAEEEGEGQEFNIVNSLWFATASMLQQGGDNTPKSPSGRILVSAFWFFILIIISTYTANLAAFLTNKKVESPIKDLEDLVHRSDMKYGVLKTGQLGTFLQKSKVPVHRKMASHMEEYQSYATSSSKGVQKARKGGYAYISETPILEYYNNIEPCNTMVVKNLLEVKSYGFGLPKNSELTNELSVAILNLRETGYIEQQRKFWWVEKSECINTAPTSNTETLRMDSLGGVFVVMIGGIVISFVLLVIEVKFKWVVDLVLKAQENSSVGSPEHARNVRVEISQGERALNPISRAQPAQRRRWFPSFGTRH